MGENTTQEEHSPGWTQRRSWWTFLADPGGLSPPPGFLLRDMDCELGLLTMSCLCLEEMTDHQISTPSSPSTRQRNPGSQLDRCLRGEKATLWRRSKTLPSIVLDGEDNMNRNISPRNNFSETVVNQHLSNISVFYL